MYDWERDKGTIADLIGGAPADLKLMTKVKNNPAMLRRWIDHHRKIVGLENLIVLDNNSTDEETMAVLGTYDGLLTISFSVFHNRVHRVHEFPELYAALRRSCRYYQVLDVDEYLGFVDDDLRVKSGSDIVAILATHQKPVIPTAWIENVLGFADRFHFNHPDRRLRLNMSHGKPLISGDTPVSGMINHNFQVAEDLYGPLITNFFVFHLLRLTAEQRMNANLTKLIANKIVPPGASVADVLALDPEAIVANNNNPRNWAREIHDLAKAPPADPNSSLEAGEIGIEPDGGIVFSEDWQANALRKFLREPEAARRKIFRR